MEKSKKKKGCKQPPALKAFAFVCINMNLQSYFQLFKEGDMQNAHFQNPGLQVVDVSSFLYLKNLLKTSIKTYKDN